MSKLRRILGLHEHEWEIFKVMPMEYAKYYRTEKLGTTPVTDVYSRCKTCPQTRIDEWKGKWTLEELKGK